MSRCAPVKKSHPGPVGGCMTCQFLFQNKKCEFLSDESTPAKSYSHFVLPKSHVHNDNAEAHWLASKPHESKFLDPPKQIGSGFPVSPNITLDRCRNKAWVAYDILSKHKIHEHELISTDHQQVCHNDWLMKLSFQVVESF